jgi:hypothetical protein
MSELFVGILGYMVFIHPVLKVDTIMLATFILVEVIRLIYLQQLFFQLQHAVCILDGSRKAFALYQQQLF